MSANLICQAVWPANKYKYMSEELYNIDKILLKLIKMKVRTLKLFKSNSEMLHS